MPERCTCRRSRSSPRRSCCRCRSSAGGSRWHRRSPSTARPASDAMAQIVRAGTRALRAGLLDRPLPGRHADSASAQRVRYKTGGARLAHRRCTCRSCRSRTTPVSCGRRACWASGRARSRCRSASRSRPRHRLTAAELMLAVETWIEGEVRGSASRGDDRARLALERSTRPSATRDERAADGRCARIVLVRRSDRIPADPRAAPIDRHGSASRRTHRARAALGDDARHRAGADASAPRWIVRSLDEWRMRRRDVMPREWKSGAPIVYRGGELALAYSTRRSARRSRPTCST